MILLKFHGLPIKGESKVEGHDDWIEIDSYQWGCGRNISSNGKMRDPSLPSFSDFNMTRSNDLASAALQKQALVGKSQGKAEIHVLQTHGNKTNVVAKIELGDAIITSYSYAVGSEGRGNESLSLNCTWWGLQYNSFDGKKVTEGKQKVWDCVAQKEMPT